MEACVRLAKGYRVRLGAHPGVSSQFGRGPIQILPAALELIVIQQASALQTVAKAQKSSLQHIKLHGSLYHLVDTDPVLARTYVAVVARWYPGIKIFASAGGLVEKTARASHTPVWAEAFADRAYNDDGTLVPRTKPGAVFTQRTAILERVSGLATRGQMMSVRGKVLQLNAQTLCVHADTSGSVAIARAMARLLGIRRRR